MVFIVAGGQGGLSSIFGENPGDRTETFIEGSNSWTLESRKLPSEQKLVWLSMLSMDNRVFTSGNLYFLYHV